MPAFNRKFGKSKVRAAFSAASGSSEAYVSGDSSQGLTASAATHSTGFFGGFGGHGK